MEATSTPGNRSICTSISLTSVTSQTRWERLRSWRKLSTSSISSRAPASLASAKARAMLRSVPPTYMSRMSEARLTTSGRPRCSASQRPKAVLPVPGGPWRQSRPACARASPSATASRSVSALMSAGS